MEMSKKARVLQIGCGPIGCSVVRFASKREDIELVGAVDIDDSLAGRDLGEVAGINGALGLSISPDLDAMISQGKPDAVFLTTSSSVKTIYPDILKCIEHGVNVVSTCEELSWPYTQEPVLSAELDRKARAKNVTVLGTGVNPGFLMDSWPLFMTAVCQEVRRVKVVRIQDASFRRGPFQKKIGAGSTPEEFKKLVAEKAVRHVGLPESISMIASGLGWELDDITESFEPVIVRERVKTEFVNVESGQVAGVRQIGKGIRRGEDLVVLEFEAAVGAPESYDAMHITGTPNIDVTIKGGINGDIATAAITVNSVHRVIDGPPGLLTMKDVPPVYASGYQDT
jgi:4-hydroxy-tetrahydrodipicolinate reductase